MITPLDIENKKFSKKTFNGYDPEEVDVFLDDLTKDYESLYRQSSENQKVVDDLKSQLEHYKQIETAMQGTLLMAQNAAEEAKNTAKKEAEHIIKEAESKAKESTTGLDSEIKLKKKELDELQKQFDVYKAKMESLLISQLELLKDINNDK